MGENEECAEMIQAVGKFYRVSLSGGRQVVTVRDELDCVKNYIRIPNIRYGDTITVKYSVDDRLLDQQVLKLILQPIVENAIHHGINAKYKRERSASRPTVIWTISFFRHRRRKRHKPGENPGHFTRKSRNRTLRLRLQHH